MLEFFPHLLYLSPDSAAHVETSTPVTLPIPLEFPLLCTVIRHLDFISKTWQEEEFPKTVEMLPQS